jgi:hypothetical protein
VAQGVTLSSNPNTTKKKKKKKLVRFSTEKLDLTLLILPTFSVDDPVISNRPCRDNKN